MGRKFSNRIAAGALLLTSLAWAPPAGAAAHPKPLFAADSTIRLTIRGPIALFARGGGAGQPRPGTMTVHGSVPETLAVRLSRRGITRLKRDVCQFPPLRVELDPPPATSLFSGQKRLKLVTHCRAAASFQQHLLLEYAAYRLYNALTPASFMVRLASIDYVDDGGRPVTSRLGFFIEEHEDVAERNGMVRPDVGQAVALSRLGPAEAARMALFEYMIGNLDWSMRAGPPGERCCHNSRLIAGSREPGAALVPLPYDFDFSGLVDAPYATPPDSIPVKTVRRRYYNGYCAHNSQALAAAAEFRAKRPALEAALAGVPQLEPRSRQQALAYLASFFTDIATDESVAARVLKTCASR